MDRIYYETANIVAAVLAKKSTIRKGVYDSHIPVGFWGRLEKGFV
jgi:hypothetical protein